MGFPASPINGEQVRINGKTYVYNSAKSSWAVVVSSGSLPGTVVTPAGTVSGNLVITDDLTVANDAAVSGNVTITGTTDIAANLTVGGVLTDNYYYANGSAFSPGGGAAGSITTYATTASLPLSANAGAMAYVFSTNRLYIFNSGWYSIAAVTQTPTFSDTPGTAVNLGENANSYSYTLVASDPEGVPLTYGFTVVSGLNANLASINSSTGVFTADFSSISDAQITFTASDGVNIASATSTFYYADSDFEYTTLLLKAVGSNTQTNSTFIDSSTNNFTVTRNGDITQGSFTPFYGEGYYSTYFDGTGDFLSFTPNSSFAFGTGDFTVECWYYPTAAVTSEYLIDNRNASQLATWVLTYNWTGSNSGTLYWYNGSTALAQSSGSTITNSWNHIVYVRSGTTGSLYINGTRVATQTDNTNYSNTPLSSTIGNRYTNTGGDQYAKGYLSNFRVVKGTAVYNPTQSTITIPSTSLTAITNTSLLTCHSNRFKDSSTNNFTITRNGDAKITTFGPFNPPSVYSSATTSGSAYFDGTGDYLTVASNSALDFGTEDFTIEMWVNFSALTSNRILLERWTSGNASGWQLYWRATGTSITFFANNAVILQDPSASRVTIGQWHHIAVTRSGTTARLFIDGTQVASATNSTSLTNSLTLSIGRQLSTNTNDFNGYMSNIRIVKGTALYTANFTPSTSPLTAVANTSLLISATNAGVIDASRKHNLAMVGSTAVSTVQKKFTTENSIAGAAAGYILAPASPELEFGSGDFTIEMWWYPNNTIRQALYHGSWGTDWSVGIDYSSVSTNQKIGIWASSNGSSWNLINADAGGNGIGTTTVTQNAWNHIAFVRNGTTWMLFVNGNRDLNLTGISGSIVNRVTSQKAIGAWFSEAAMQEQLGYLQDFRISKYARYTANFTPTTRPFLTR